MLHETCHLLKTKSQEIEAWFASQWRGLTPPIYLSCDIRHSGYKMAVVDTNLFPAGFNNLCKVFSEQTSKAFDGYLGAYHPAARRILLLGESHTRNKFYLKNLLHLKNLLTVAGREVAIGMMNVPFADNPMNIHLDDSVVPVFKLHRDGDKIACDGFIPDLVLSNNDFSEGFPSFLEGLVQPIIPHPTLGWHRRRKSAHFRAFKKVLDGFGAYFRLSTSGAPGIGSSATDGLDTWSLYPATYEVGGIDLDDPASVKTLADAVGRVLGEIQAEYAKRQVVEAPYVYIKNNAGTYGMGLISVFSAEEVLSLNRKRRNKLVSSKGNALASEFIIQEGIPTIDTYSEAAIEPVIYAVGAADVGGFFRVHNARNQFESLNAPGMSFSCLCLHKLDEPHESYFIDCKQKEDVVEVARFLTRLAALAVAKEGAP